MSAMVERRAGPLMSPGLAPLVFLLVGPPVGAVLFILVLALRDPIAPADLLPALLPIAGFGYLVGAIPAVGTGIVFLISRRSPTFVRLAATAASAAVLGAFGVGKLLRPAGGFPGPEVMGSLAIAAALAALFAAVLVIALERRS